MVWIYGGGLVFGGTSQNLYDGSEFARKGIVFVSLNYRLGRFGFFAFPELTRESKSGLLGNYGYFDQLAALKWVQRNIAAFGGDPKQVTLAGESAGGFSVHVMMTSPMSTGLFARSIVQSGGGRTMMGSTGVREGRNGQPSGEEIGVAFAKSKGITGSGPEALKQLRVLPAENIVDGLSMATMLTARSTYPGPMVDGEIVVGEPQKLYQEGKYRHVPLLIGATSMDMGFSFATTMQEVFAPFGASQIAAQEAYDAASFTDAHVLGLKVSSDQFMVEPARYVARTLSSQGVGAWEFRFGYVPESMRKQSLGASHGSDIAFAFDTVKLFYGTNLAEGDEKAAQQMNAYWANFVKTGNPNGSGLPNWPEFQTASDMLMDFTDNGPVGEADPWKKRLDMTEKVATQQAAQ